MAEVLLKIKTGQIFCPFFRLAWRPGTAHFKRNSAIINIFRRLSPTFISLK